MKRSVRLKIVHCPEAPPRRPLFTPFCRAAAVVIALRAVWLCLVADDCDGGIGDFLLAALIILVTD